MNIVIAMDLGLTSEKQRLWSLQGLGRGFVICPHLNLDLDLVDDYVYLGICFNWNGSYVIKQKNSFMIKHRRPCTH